MLMKIHCGQVKDSITNAFERVKLTMIVCTSFGDKWRKLFISFWMGLSLRIKRSEGSILEIMT